jgi:hypothetical protein
MRKALVNRLEGDRVEIEGDGGIGVSPAGRCRDPKGTGIIRVPSASSESRQLCSHREEGGHAPGSQVRRRSLPGCVQSEDPRHRRRFRYPGKPRQQHPPNLRNLHRPFPVAVGTPRPLSALAMPFSDVIPPRRMSAMMGARSAAPAAARFLRAFKAASRTLAPWSSSRFGLRVMEGH